MNFKYLFYFVFIICLFTLSCQSNQYNMLSQTSTMSVDNLYNTKWILKQTDQLKHSAHLTIKADGKINGFSGCNSFFGNAKISNNKITIGRLATTRKMCPEKMDFESKVISGLSSITNYKIEGNASSKTLYLHNEKSEIFTFTYRIN